VSQDAQGDQRGQPLPVGRDLVQRQATVLLAHGADPFAVVLGQVGERHRPAGGARCVNDPPSQVAAVEGLAFAGGDGLQRAGHVGAAEDLARQGRPTAG
jgi:hypothetical protein